MPQVWLLALALIAVGSFAAETQHYCGDPDVNRQWQEARARFPDDPLVLGLATQRETLCGLVADGTIKLDKAQSLWQTALTDALLERARAEQRERGLLRLFATF